MTFFYPYILYFFSRFILISFSIFHFSFCPPPVILTVNNILPILFPNLVLLFHAVKKSPVEITILKLGKNNKEITPLYSFLLAVKME